ncbi:MAG: hypothetical protein R3C59_27135 [Planctomycetaceae bacterium]
MHNLPRLRSLHRTVPVMLSAVIVFGCSGCGGENLSEPPSEIADRLARLKAEGPASSNIAPPPPDTEAGSDSHESESAPEMPKATTGTTATGDVPPSSATSADSPAISSENNTPGADSVLTNSSESASRSPKPEPPKNAAVPPVPGTTLDRAAGAEIEGEVVTAGGKTATNVRRDQNSSESTADAGMSLLDKLKVIDEKDKAKETNQRAGTARPATATRPQLTAVIQKWKNAEAQLLQGALVSVSDDGRQIAVATGPTALIAVSFPDPKAVTSEHPAFPQSIPGRPSTEGSAATIPVTMPIDALPGEIAALELLPDRDEVMIGTRDGRLLTRSVSSLPTPELYAHDLRQFQEEHRPETRISDSSLLMLKVVSSNRLVTVSEGGIFRVWSLAEVAHAPIPVTDMTEQQARQATAELAVPEPLREIAVPDVPVLSLCCSGTGHYCALVTNDERVTILDTESGEVLESIDSQQLDDTPPTAAVFDDDDRHYLVGLVDGRVVRRAITGSEAASSEAQSESEAANEVVFAPEPSDRSGAVTALAMDADSGVLYIGRLDGSVLPFHPEHRNTASAERRHQGPLTLIRPISEGSLTLGVDRVVKRSASTTPPGTSVASAASSYTLPRDTTVRRRTADPDEDTSGAPNPFTQKRVLRKSIQQAGQQSHQLAARSENPVMTMYEHRLRLAEDPQLRAETRNMIQQQPEFDATFVPSDSKKSPSDLPELTADVITRFDYSQRPTRRTLLSISEDGLTMATGQSLSTAARQSGSGQPVVLLDNPTGTILRQWNSFTHLSDLSLDMSLGLVIPSPLSARLRVFDGDQQVDELQRCRLWARQPGQSRIVAGLAGFPGVAAPAIVALSPESKGRHEGVQAFEGAVPALAFSADGRSLFVSLRERTTLKLLDVNPETLAIRSELSAEKASGTWNPDERNQQRGRLGTTLILPSESGRLLLTYGEYPDGDFQIRIWKRGGTTSGQGGSASEIVSNWRQDDVVVVPSKTNFVDRDMTATPITFVRNRDTQIAVVGPKGLTIANTKDGEIQETLALDDVVGRRPVTLFSPDGRWFLAGDSAGKIHLWDLARFHLPPRVFDAHSGPIIGMQMSASGEFLVTAGEENRIRTWQINEFLEGKTSTARR